MACSCETVSTSCRSVPAPCSCQPEPRAEGSWAAPGPAPPPQLCSHWMSTFASGFCTNLGLAAPWSCTLVLCDFEAIIFLCQLSHNEVFCEAGERVHYDLTKTRKEILAKGNRRCISEVIIEICSLKNSLMDSWTYRGKNCLSWGLAVLPLYFAGVLSSKVGPDWPFLMAARQNHEGRETKTLKTLYGLMNV